MKPKTRPKTPQRIGYYSSCLCFFQFFDIFDIFVIFSLCFVSYVLYCFC